MGAQNEPRPLKALPSRLPMAVAFSLGVALAGGVLAWTLVETGQTGHPTSTIGSGWTCVPGPRSSCTLAAAASNRLIGPVASWCLANNSYAGGYLTGTTWTCDPTPMVLSFNETVGAILSGTFSVNGPFELFLVPALQGCVFVSSLEATYENVLWSCAPPVGNWTPYPSSNLAPQVSNPEDLSSLTYDSGHLSPAIRPAFWSLMIVDTGTQSESVHVDTALTVAPE